MTISKSDRNAIHNAKNPWQGNSKRVLCVCSAGLLRSPTTANVLHKTYGFNTRACGVNKDFALIHINEALLEWAEEIVFVNRENFLSVQDAMTEEQRAKSTVLNIPDRYEFMEKALQEIILEQYEESKS